MNGTTVSGNVSYGGNGTGHGDNQLGSVTLTKRDSTTKAVLRGAEYQLRDSTGEVIESGLTTNENGDINITDLIPGQYQFVETKAPVGYTLNSTPINFKIDADTVATPVEVTQFDETAVVTGSVVLTKVAANSGQTLAGAIYNLKDGAGQTIRHGLKTDTRGQIRVDELVPGRYQFIKTKAPAGYALNQTPLDFTIVEGQTAAVTVKATDQLVQPIKPEQPGATKPVKPSPIKPEQPGDTESAQPSPTKPKQPGTTKPAEPSTSEPKQPSSTKPAESSTTIPEQSSTNTSQITGLNNGTTDSNVTVPNGQDSVGSTGNGSLAVAADQSGQVSKAVTLPQTSENHQSLLIAILGLALLLLMLVWLPAK